MCWMAPGPAMSASVNVSPALISTDGETFQPLPRSRAARAPVPLIAWPPPPFAPVKFSGLIDRVFARESRLRSPTPVVSPLNGRSPRAGWASARAGLANKLDAPMAASRSRRFTESSSAWLGGNGAECSTVLSGYRLQAAGYGLLPSTFSAMTPVLITGCSSGIGAAIAARLARADWPVYATARRLDMLD